jgi:predicted HTH domain antitoxin
MVHASDLLKSAGNPLLKSNTALRLVFYILYNGRETKPLGGLEKHKSGRIRGMDETNSIQWEVSQLVKTKLFPDEQAVLRSALRALFESRPEIRRQMIIRAYTAGEISLGKAAEIMGCSHEEMKDILQESQVEIHMGPRTVDELLRDANNA